MSKLNVGFGLVLRGQNLSAFDNGSKIPNAPRRVTAATAQRMVTAATVPRRVASATAHRRVAAATAPRRVTSATAVAEGAYGDILMITRFNVSFCARSRF